MAEKDLIRRVDVLNLAKDIVFTDDKGRPVFKHICVNLENVRSIPAVDAVEVVRCKDCKYCHIEDEYEAWCHGGLPAVLTRATEDFCSHGQRREEAGET